MTNTYTHYKNLYNNTKPIRGRSTEVRPIGKRRRDWEKIVRNDLPDGGHSYAAKLYDTQVVEYMPNGDIILRSKGWHTPSTAEFIHEHSPFRCWKQNKQLWVQVLSGDSDRMVTYPIGDELHLRLTDARRYEPVTPIVIKKKVIDRAKAKVAREPVMPFLQWTKTFLSLSDGWVMHETMKQVLGWHEDGLWTRYRQFGRSSVELYDKVADPEANEETYLDVLCSMVFSRHVTVLERRTAESVQLSVAGQMRGQTFHDLRTDYAHIKETMYRWVRKFADVSKTVEVQPGVKAVHNAVV